MSSADGLIGVIASANLYTRGLDPLKDLLVYEDGVLVIGGHISG